METVKPEITDYLTEVIEPTCVAVQRRYFSYVDLDDLIQEAALWWYGPGQKFLPKYTTEDENYVRLRRSIYRWVQRYAEREKAHARGYEPIDQVRYSPRQILDMLPIAMDPDGIPDGGGVHDDGPHAKGNLAEGGDILATLIDVRRALAALTEDDLHFLTLVSDLAQDWDRVAAHTATLADSCRRRHARICERMARWLNDDTEEDAA